MFSPHPQNDNKKIWKSKPKIRQKRMSKRTQNSTHTKTKQTNNSGVHFVLDNYSRTWALPWVCRLKHPVTLSRRKFDTKLQVSLPTAPLLGWDRTLTTPSQDWDSIWIEVVPGSVCGLPPSPWAHLCLGPVVVWRTLFPWSQSSPQARTVFLFPLLQRSLSLGREDLIKIFHLWPSAQKPPTLNTLVQV